MTRLLYGCTLAFSVFLSFMAEGEAGEYVVQSGDSLQKIARIQLGNAERWQEIADRNGLQPPYRITPGQVLDLPNGQVSQRGPSASSGWLLALLTFVVGWYFFTLCIRVGCWLALVDTSFVKCALLALILVALSVVFSVAAYKVAFSMLNSLENFIAVPALLLLLLLLYLVSAVLATKKLLKCKWRSVISVAVLSTFVSYALTIVCGILAFLLFPGLREITLVSNVLDTFM